MSEAIELFDESKIVRKDTLQRIFSLLKSKGEKSNHKGVELLNKYRNTEPAKGKLVRHMEKRAPIQNYLVQGHVKTISKYS